MRHLVFVIYDGIQNSVFQSQVLQPLLKRLAEQPDLHITLVSFERASFSYETMSGIVPALDRFDVIIARRLPFVGRASLIDAVRRMHSILLMLSATECIARGPLAGYVVLKAFSVLLRKARRLQQVLNADELPSVIIQARGLAAEEYRYTKTRGKANALNTIISWGFYSMLRKVETLVYGGKLLYAQAKPVAIETVSRALKMYLELHYGANPALTRVADYDVPTKLTHEERTAWRVEIRNKLGIASDAAVYCYSGSYKPWQCVEETRTHFMQVQENDPRAFLLVLSADQEIFAQKLRERGLALQRYFVTNAKPEELYHYLSAADFGYLLREADVINWVSRPTKLLEYQAAGLMVIHNNTIGLLSIEAQA